MEITKYCLKISGRFLAVRVTTVKIQKAYKVTVLWNHWWLIVV
jgi:hypothetical protein